MLPAAAGLAGIRPCLWWELDASDLEAVVVERAGRIGRFVSGGRRGLEHRPSVAAALAVGCGGVSRCRGGITAVWRAGCGGGWFFGVGSFVGGPFRLAIPLPRRPALPSSKGRSSPSCDPSPVSRPTAGPRASCARQQDRPRLAPGSRTDLVSCPVPLDGSMEASFGRPTGSRCWGPPRGAKGGSFPLVSSVGVAAGLR